MRNSKKKEILDFIKHFQNEGTISTFMEGCCYWFAHILKSRFVFGSIVYEPIMCHFLYQLDGICYDITGEVDTSKLHIVDWNTYELNSPFRKKVHKDCILKK